MPFNPRELTPTASLNRVRIVDLPGVSSRYALRDEERNKTAYELLGAQAIYDLIRARAEEMGIPHPTPQYPTDEIMTAFQAALNSRDKYVRQLAQEIRSTLHRRIAILLAVLRRGDPINREARPEWDESYWAYWSSRTSLMLGGGLLRDKMGKGLITNGKSDFHKMLTHFGAQGLTVSCDVNGPYLPLIGAGAAAEDNNAPVAVLDFGGTSVKAGIARYVRTRLSMIEQITISPTSLGEPYSLRQQTDAEKQVILQAMAERIAQIIVSSRYAAYIQRAIVSVAAYIDPHGHPYPNSIGGYAGLQTTVPNLQQALAQVVSEKVGRDIQVLLLHDGTAAATAYPGFPVIVFGTAIGVGTHPAVENPSGTARWLCHLEFSRKKNL
jgi:hypothetical protein